MSRLVDTRGKRALAALLPLAIGLGGCSSTFISERPLAWQVTLASPKEVATCASKGGVQVTAAAYLWFYRRDDAAVEQDLLRLARNAAIDAGGDTIVKGDSPKPGTRDFSIYRCGS